MLPQSFRDRRDNPAETDLQELWSVNIYVSLVRMGPEWFQSAAAAVFSTHFMYRFVYFNQSADFLNLNMHHLILFPGTLLMADLMLFPPNLITLVLLLDFPKSFHASALGGISKRRLEYLRGGGPLLPPVPAHSSTQTLVFLRCVDTKMVLCFFFSIV